MKRREFIINSSRLAGAIAMGEVWSSGTRAAEPPGRLQMELARIANAGVGVSNGWIEYTGLHGLPAEVKTKMVADIATLFGKPSAGERP
jgi:hypothetical protein